MPIEVHEYSELGDIDQQEQIRQLYDISPEFGDGMDALEQLKIAMARGDKLYTAEFNDKIIAAIWSRGQGDSRKLQYIVTHHANRGRGVAEALIRQLCDNESKLGVLHFYPGCGAIHRILDRLNRLSTPEEKLAS